MGWKNIEHLRGGVELKPKAQWQLSGSFHAWWLADEHDALYNAGGAAIARSVAGTAGRFVGQEIDGGATYNYSPQLQISGGYSRILPGEFLNTTTPGESYNYAHVMFTYVFIGDRPVAVGKGQTK